ncbi:histidinol-phosphatase [Rhodobaculum claviforme]|uniref:Histidinol-phosphatase n=1 Tax=Rhodobaculum claviforme TaxID=1549854 RepID=A0A934TLP9_9RHOB|nr:histidinol-phosphatase [Rhodobaculum claviforme]MBK5927831.1 histidinol-phosphatase [Rhodobaculum claviforme]
MAGPQLTDDAAQELLATALDLADAARTAVLPYFRAQDLAADNKATAGFDPVTAADHAAESAMRAILAARRPQDAILGEEGGATAGTSGLTWVLDPIDGTRAFLAGAPTWGVLIALSDVTGPRIGVIDQPWTGERFVGTPTGAWMDGPRGRQALTTRPARPLEQAILLSTFPEIGTDAERAAFQELSARCRLTRYGLDCYAYALIAAGQIDLVVEAGLHPYDIHAPIAVIEAAGGVVTDWRGGPAHGGGRVLAAANPSIHAEALAILSRA